MPEKRGQELGLLGAVALVVGNMIGSGVFLLPASLAPFGWGGVVGWVVTISGALMLALSLARMTGALPQADGPTGFVTEAFGPMIGFLISWIYLISVISANVTIAVAAVSYFSSVVPAVSAVPGGPAIAAFVLMWALVLVNLGGVGLVGRLQIATVALKLVPLVLVLAITAGVMLSGQAHLPPFEAKDISLPAVNGAAALTLWALLGFESASVTAAKVDNPEVNVPRATMWGTALTGLLYLLVCTAIAMLLPLGEVAHSPAPFAAFVEHFWRPDFAPLIALFAIVSCVGALNGWILLQGELTREMAVMGMLPASLAATDARGTPRFAIYVTMAAASVMLAMNSSRSMQAMFEYLLLLSTSAALWLYLFCALAAVRLRVIRPVALLGALYALWTLWGAGIGASRMSLLLMLTGLPIWWWMQRTRAAVAGSDQPV